MKIRNRYEERKQYSKNDIQKSKLENFFGIKFDNDEQFYDFLDELHKPITFEKSMLIQAQMIYGLVSEGNDMIEVIDALDHYMELYCQKLKEGKVEEEDDYEEDGTKYGWYQGVVEESIDDGLREHEDIDKVAEIYRGFLETIKNEYLQLKFKNKRKKKR